MRSKIFPVILVMSALAAETAFASWFPQRVGRRMSRMTPTNELPEAVRKEVEDDAVDESEANESLFLSLMRTLEDAVEEASADVGIDDEEVDDPAPVLPAPLAPRLGLSADSSNTGDFETYNRRYGYERYPGGTPRNVDGMSNFGAQMSASSSSQRSGNAGRPLPQLVYTDPEPAAMNLLGQFGNGLLRQSDDGPSVDVEDSSDDEVRCIPKVMQVWETEYDRAIKCHHSYQEKCHMTYITDYRSTTEQKCETTFKKNCHITFKPMPFNETVNVCHTPVVRQCGDSPVGPEICSTHYETNCETRYKTYEIEQDEPVCTMELMKKCNNITLPGITANGGDGFQQFRQSRQRYGRQDDQDGEDGSDPPSDPPTDLEAVDDSATPTGSGGVTIEQQCEEWPVQRCTLEKKTVKKIHPDTACRKIPREVCVPNNCAMVQGDEICRDENRMLVQNVPQEECELQPEENCHMEAVLVPRLVPKPNCVKVPKEICVNTKKNPRRVKKPVVKEWCYRPKDLLENPGTFPGGLLNDINNNNSNNNNNDDGGDEDSEAVPSQRRRQKKLFSLFY